jgi:hypothetical protein
VGSRARCVRCGEQNNLLPPNRTVAVPAELSQPVVSEYARLQKRVHEMTATPDSRTAELCRSGCGRKLISAMFPCQNVMHCGNNRVCMFRIYLNFSLQGVREHELLRVSGISCACLS